MKNSSCWSQVQGDTQMGRTTGEWILQSTGGQQSCLKMWFVSSLQKIALNYRNAQLKLNMKLGLHHPEPDGSRFWLYLGHWGPN